MNIYTYTTDDENGTNTHAFLDIDERDKLAFQWILAKLTQWNKDHAPFIGLPVVEAYELFETTIKHGQDYMWIDNHTVTPQEPDLSAVGNETEGLEGNTAETAKTTLLERRYAQAIDRIKDMLQGDDAQAWKEAEKFIQMVETEPTPAKPMWVVFSTVDMENGKGTYEDFYSTCETEEDAKAEYLAATAKETTYCAGYAPISQGTEPQWTDAG